MLRAPNGFVEITFFTSRRAWVAIYDDDGWPTRRLTRWVVRGEASLERALRRAGFDRDEARRRSDEISAEWGEPMGDVSEMVIPGLFGLALAAMGAISVGQRLVRLLRTS